MDTNDISACERLVMKVIWDSTEDLALQDIMNRVNQENGKAGSHRRFLLFWQDWLRNHFNSLPQGKIFILSACSKQGRFLESNRTGERKIL